MSDLEKSVTDTLTEMYEEEQKENLACAQKKIAALVDDTYAAKLAVDEAEKKFSLLKAELLTLMESSEVDKIVGKSCSATLSVKSSVTVPKDLGAKKELFNYIKTTHGEEVLDEMLTINAMSFSSWYNAEVNAHIAQGKVDFKLDMLTPYDRTSVGLRKIAVKKSK